MNKKPDDNGNIVSASNTIKSLELGSSKVNKPVSDNSNKQNKGNDKTLPQTGDKEDTGLEELGLISLTLIIGLAARRKRREE
ncbi:LPXTG cell wall anchor domain-containing protein [Lactiplantibacillus plantarum]|uniref:LPXTG cell wall anchor domain-containing protein n=1 Tax=Lactiplantibacillus plantarum TaxID=1590 RepID=UPI003965C66E